MDFGYKNLHNYKSVRFDNDDLEYLKMYYADEIIRFLIKKCAYLERVDIKRMLINTPEDIKKELKKIFFKNLRKYSKEYIKSLLNLRSYIRNKKEMK